jgi:hypothetical protein
MFHIDRLNCCKLLLLNSLLYKNKMKTFNFIVYFIKLIARFDLNGIKVNILLVNIKGQLIYLNRIILFMSVRKFFLFFC